MERSHNISPASPETPHAEFTTRATVAFLMQHDCFLFAQHCMQHLGGSPGDSAVANSGRLAQHLGLRTPWKQESGSDDGWGSRQIG